MEIVVKSKNPIHVVRMKDVEIMDIVNLQTHLANQNVIVILDGLVLVVIRRYFVVKVNVR